VNIGESRVGDYLVLRPVGRLDTRTTAEFQTRLLELVTAGPADVIVDFAEVDYISSAGLRSLMAAVKAKPKGRRIAVATLNALVQEIYTIARFQHVIPAFDSVEAGIAAWTPAAEPGVKAEAVSSNAPRIGVRFWGTRGSLPVALNHSGVRAKIRAALLAVRERDLASPEAIDAFLDTELPFSVKGTFGGNTSCVEIETGGDEYLLCDLGSGAREFGNRVLAKHGPGRANTFNIFMSHVHWDHIMGFPFFVPAYIPGNRLRIYGCHDILREALQRQHAAPSFPVEFSALGSTIEFIELEPGVPCEVAGFSVTPIKQFHSGDSYGYRFERDGKAIVYTTDCEHKAQMLDSSYPFVQFYRDADLLIFDTMYSLADAISVKEDWGHSSNLVAVELAQLAKAKRLVMFHHEPAYDDAKIEGVFAETVRFEEISREGHKVEVIAAYDGLELFV
jgi:anti-anti-sigma factor